MQQQQCTRRYFPWRRKHNVLLGRIAQFAQWVLVRAPLPGQHSVGQTYLKTVQSEEAGAVCRIKANAGVGLGAGRNFKMQCLPGDADATRRDELCGFVIPVLSSEVNLG